MFLVWDPNGVHAPYLEGAVRDRRVERVDAVARIGRERSRRDPPGDPEPHRHGTPGKRSRGALRAGQIMSAPVVTLPPSATLDAATTLIRERRFRHVPIRSPHGRIVGVISDRDLLRHGDRHRHEPISAVMATPVLTAAPETELRDVARVLLAERIGSMPIVEAGELRGILTRTDILRAVVHHGALDLFA